MDDFLDLDETAHAAAEVATGSVRPDRRFDPGTMVIGIWFAVLGIVAAIAGGDLLDDLPPVVIPISFAVVGLALLLPKRPVPRRDRRSDRDW